MNLVSNIPDWSIVVVGSWNQQIFTPPWMGSGRLTEAKEIQAAISFGSFGQSITFGFDGIKLGVSPDRLVIHFESNDDETLKKGCAVAKKILEDLPQTPVRAVGINFGYRIESPTSEFLTYFNLADNGIIIDNNYEIHGTTITRKLCFDEEVANLKLELVGSKDPKIEVNYHYEVDNALTAVPKVDCDIVELKEKVIKFLCVAYQMEA